MWSSDSVVCFTLREQSSLTTILLGFRSCILEGGREGGRGGREGGEGGRKVRGREGGREGGWSIFNHTL